MVTNIPLANGSRDFVHEKLGGAKRDIVEEHPGDVVVLIRPYGGRSQSGIHLQLIARSCDQARSEMEN